MQRDFGNEVTVAILAVGALVFALAFGIILSLSGTGGSSGSAAPTGTAVVQQNDEPSETAVPEQESEAAPSSTPAPTDTATRRPASPTPRATDTPRPTATLRPTERPTSTPTATDTHTPSPVPSATPLGGGGCNVPEGWTVYVVRPGDTLELVARATGAALSELLSVNCLSQIAPITPGSTLYVPRQPYTYGAAGSAAATSTATPFSGVEAEGCSDAAVQITTPQPGQLVSGVFSLVGSAGGDRFARYWVEVRPDFASIYDLYLERDAPVQAGELGQVNSDAYGRGLHWVRLRVLDDDGEDVGETCAIPMIFD